MKNKEAERLKRLARQFANATADLSWLGATDPEDHARLRENHAKTRARLYEAIDAIVAMAESGRATPLQAFDEEQGD